MLHPLQPRDDDDEHDELLTCPIRLQSPTICGIETRVDADLRS